MISQAFSQVNNIACAIYHKISLNISVGYCRIECTASSNDAETNILYGFYNIYS